MFTISLALNCEEIYVNKLEIYCGNDLVDLLVRGLVETANSQHDLIRACIKNVDLADHGFVNGPQIALVEQK